MAIRVYDYPLSAFTSLKTDRPSLVGLKQEIERFRDTSGNPIPVACLGVGSGVTFQGPVIQISFATSLSSEMKGHLDDIVSATEGFPYSTVASVDIGLSTEEDGRLNVVNTPMPLGWSTNFVGSDDNGKEFYLALSGGESNFYVKEFKFNQNIRIHDVQFSWSAGWSENPNVDKFHVLAESQANLPLENASENGNAVRDTSLGYPRYLPVTSGGTHDVILNQGEGDHSPILNPSKRGGWDVRYIDGAVIPNYEGKGWYDIIEPAVTFAYFLDMPFSNPRNFLDVDIPKSDYFHHTYTLKLAVKKYSANAGWFSAWVLKYVSGPLVPPQILNEVNSGSILE